MSAKKTTGAITAAEIDAKLPRRFFVMRGDIQNAFGFTKEETATLIEQKIFVAEYPLGRKRRARFVRALVLTVARNWEKSA
jgi:hypothetical protein